MTVSQLASALTGSWTLLQWTTQTQDVSGTVLKTHQPFGSSPAGLLIYSADGFVSATVCRSDRKRFPHSVSPRALSDEVQADAFKTFFHYAGCWTIVDGQIHHEVSLALNPNLVGTIQLRSPSLSEGGLCLEGMEPIGQITRRHVIEWARPNNASLPLTSALVDGQF